MRVLLYLRYAGLSLSFLAVGFNACSSYSVLGYTLLFYAYNLALGVPKYSLERHSKSRSRSRSRSTLPTLDRTPKKGVDTTQNLDTGLNINQNLEGSERSMHHHDGNSSQPHNKSVRAKRHSRSRTRSKTPMNGQKKSPYHNYRTPRETFPIVHCDNAKTPETLYNPKHLSVPAKRYLSSRSKSRSRS